MIYVDVNSLGRRVPPYFYGVQLWRVDPRGHKSRIPKRPRAPFRHSRLMLVGSKRPASAFLGVQLQGLEARGHKSKTSKRPRAPFRCLRLMLVASEQAPSAFLILCLKCEQYWNTRIGCGLFTLYALTLILPYCMLTKDIEW